LIGDPPQRERRVLLHFGPPKTGTSALQAWCARNRGVLARYGVHYASVDNDEDPKHQWLLKEFRTGRFDRLQSELAQLVGGTLVLSCEGIMVHRGKIAPEQWAAFRAVFGGIDRSLFLVQRETGPWHQSLWRQGVLNPPQQGRLIMPSPEAFSVSRWLQEMTDLPDLARRMAGDTGAGTICIARFEANWLAEFKTLAGLPDDPALGDLPRVNESAPEVFVQLYLALGSGRDDVTDLRRVLFAVYCRRFPTTNLTLQNTARKFAALPPADQRQQLRTFVADLRVFAAPSSDVTALAKELGAVATAWISGR